MSDEVWAWYRIVYFDFFTQYCQSEIGIIIRNVILIQVVDNQFNY